MQDIPGLKRLAPTRLQPVLALCDPTPLTPLRRHRHPHRRSPQRRHHNADTTPNRFCAVLAFPRQVPAGEGEREAVCEDEEGGWSEDMCGVFAGFGDAGGDGV